MSNGGGEESSTDEMQNEIGKISLLLLSWLDDGQGGIGSKGSIG